jgi:ubiquinone/menaquinone biosynthesis C-methylase UbiE
MAEWYEESFGEDYLLVYKHRSQEDAFREVEKMIEWLKPDPSSLILDLCCGMGRHTIAFAKKGYPVIGLDLSKRLLLEANRRAELAKLAVPFVHGDMRHLPFVEESFAVVVNLFTSFGYFEEDLSNQLVLSEMARVLKKNGVFCIDYLNRDYVIRHLVPESERMENGVFIREKRWIEGDYVYKRIWVQKEKEERTYWERVKMYSPDRFVAMLQQQGLRPEQFFGDFTGTPFHKDCPRFIVVGRKVI